MTPPADAPRMLPTKIIGEMVSEGDVKRSGGFGESVSVIMKELGNVA